MEKETFKQLMLSEQEAALTIEQRDFVETHKQIISCGTMAARYFVELARKLKHMNDTKLYAVGGFATFAEYVEEAVGIKYRQARNYIKVAETYTDAYLEEHAGAGVTKLTLLAAVTEKEREEIEEEIDIDSASTEEVNAAVQNALRERDEAHKQLSLIEGELADKKAELAESENARAAIQKAYDEEKKKLRDTKATEKILSGEVEKLKNKLSEAESAPSADKEALAAEIEKREKLEKELKEKTAQLEDARAQRRVISSSDVITFKIKFDEIQRIGNELTSSIRKMDDETAIKCRNALSALLEKWRGEWA